MPALNSYWLEIHVSAAAVATGIYLIGFLAAALHLLRTRHDVRRIWDAAPGLVDSLGRHLPATQRLGLLSFRMHAFGFPIWTFGVLAGAVWAEAAWGRYWGWDHGREVYPSLYDPTGQVVLGLTNVSANTIPATVILDRGSRVAAVLRKAVTEPEPTPLIRQVAAEDTPDG